MDNVSLIKYKICLEPDLKNFKFSGTTEILMEASVHVREVVLNAAELALWGCMVEVDGAFIDCPFYVDTRKEEIRIFFPGEMKGKIKVKINYMGNINNTMAGFYRSRYTVDGKEKFTAVTQFQETDARRAFPCFDHPVNKAIFNVEMIVDKELTALSNERISEEKLLDNGKKLVRFTETPKMSTYLLFFSVGEFDFIEDSGDVLMRGVTMPGMTEYAGFGLEFGRKSLQFCEDYYGIGYPLNKLDLIAVPDFAAGAMENWGAITFRENLLLHYPNITSKAGEERICEVIAHEMAHQWFGNLVSPSDWKYLWLNESFATYFGFGIVEHYYPDWDIWDQFLHSQTEEAFKRDALFETVSIEIPGGEHVIINASTAPIIYNKGAGILRQIEGYIGKDDLKAGLRRYLKNHEYACASSHHLWEALEDVSEKPVTRMMKSWVEQPGFPVLEVKRDEDKLILTQKRFTYLPNESEQEWLIPVTVKIFYGADDSREITTLVERKTTSIDISDDAIAYMVNYGQTGFYRIKYKEEDNQRELGKRALRKELPPQDRWALQNDMYALVRRGDVSLYDYMGFLSNYAKEDAYLPLTGIADNLFHAYLVTEGNEREKVADIGRSFLERSLSFMGYEPNPNESHTTSVLRDKIVWHAALYGSKKATEFAFAQFSSIIKGGVIHPDIIKSTMQVGAFTGNEETFAWFDKRLQSCESEHERINIMVALGSFGEKALIEKILQYVLEKIPSRNRFILLGSMTTNPHATPYMWEWYLSNLEKLEQLHPAHYERIFSGIIQWCGLGRKKEVKNFFDGYMKRNEKFNDVIRLSLEALEINSRMRAR